jgi:hypothetical protein
MMPGTSKYRSVFPLEVTILELVVEQGGAFQVFALFLVQSNRLGLLPVTLPVTVSSSVLLF